MSRPDEGLIHQWLDGECTPEEVARLEHLVATDPEWAAAVAEARGLIAASSRIVQSLDAVPRAMPAGSKAAPTIVAGHARGFQVRPWMRVAAGLVLVAGTAYVLREQTREPFTPTARVDMPAPQPAPPTGTGAAEMSRTQPPTTVPSMGPLRTADRAVPAQERGATQGAPAPVVTSQAPPAGEVADMSPPPAATKTQAPAPAVATPTIAPQPRAAEDERRRSTADAEATATRRAVLSSESPRGAVTRASAAPPSAAGAQANAPALSLQMLDGCWTITAPPALAAPNVRFLLRRQSGDTLVVVTTTGDVTVIRSADTLRGGLEATRTACPETP